ncbi:MAG: sugar phosphate isomerase/epimerase [Victivallales bacterium]|nr:sugar phosphate isomerase/epimerase [Victivallales bacterium]
MKRKIGLQLYSLRKEVEAQGMPAILKLVKEMGYQQVEPAGFGKLTAKEFAQACKDTGLEISSAHIPCALETISETIDTAKTLGLEYVCIGYGPDQFKDMDTIKASAEKSNAIIEKLEAAGLKAFQHNHYWEFALLEGYLKYKYYLDLVPKVKLELDVFWAGNFGANDPVEMVKRFAPKMQFLHLKDGFYPANPDDHTYVEMRPLGEGQLDIPAIAAATPDNVQQIIVELDKSNIDMTESVRRSHDYLVSAGLVY